MSNEWISVDDQLPEVGEWVLHTYVGGRNPMYGIFDGKQFFNNRGPESFPTTHWLRIPDIPEDVEKERE